MKHVTGKHVILGLAAIVALFALGPLVVGYGWAAFLTPLTGAPAPGFWHLLGLLVTARVALGAAYRAQAAPHQWAEARAHDHMVDEDPEYAAACYEWALGKLWGAVTGLLGVWAILWLLA